MVHYNLRGVKDTYDYAIVERLLDILESVLPDITVTKYPEECIGWATSLHDIKTTYGFQGIEESRIIIWNDTGRLISKCTEEFERFAKSFYGVNVDLREHEIEEYAMANAAL